MNFLDSHMNFLDFSPKKYKQSGTINFSIDVSIQGGQLPYHTSVISVNTHSKGNSKDFIGSNYKWFRFTDSSTFHMPDIVSNTYIISPLDIGYKLRVEVTPKEEGFTGKGYVEFGPIKLDPMIRNTLEGILSVGGSSFQAIWINDKNDKIHKNEKIHKNSKNDDNMNNMNKMNTDLNVFVTNDTIRIVRNYDQESLKFCYSVQNPQIEIVAKDLNFLTFKFIEPVAESKLSGVLMDNNRLSLRMASRISRDLLLLSIKCFAIKHYLINAKIITSLENSDLDPIKLFNDKDSNNPLMGDLYLEMNLVKNENSMLLDQNKGMRKEKEVYSTQIKNLEEEIIETIDTYTKLIADMQENPSLDESLLEKTKKDLILKKRKTSEMLESEKELTFLKKTLFKEENENEMIELQNM